MESPKPFTDYKGFHEMSNGLCKGKYKVNQKCQWDTPMTHDRGNLSSPLTPRRPNLLNEVLHVHLPLLCAWGEG